MSILLDRHDDGVAVVTLNRPDRLNALDIPAKEALAAAWREIAADPAIRAVVLHGAGPRAFCAGSDVKAMHATGAMVSTRTLMDAIPNVGTALPQPVIAALHGHCLGMGLTLALHCDLRIAAPGTRLAFPEVPHGMISGVSAVRLPTMVPPGRAMEFMLLGDQIPLEEALHLGLVNRIAEDPLAAALGWARRLAAMPPTAVQATKRLLRHSQLLDQAAQAEVEAMRDWVEQQRDFRDNAAAFERREAGARMQPSDDAA
ncbi:enoyl-CoA hydratase/isomerase family protein [Humitalea sp. 24SJ18S-53]|uniref:enoyl-CoA hydratase/isomerase family protein n=1 Tax=Humitalea sp. 24SJ18S-53 TaxID=3422307 RepID=UPI003D669291